VVIRNESQLQIMCVIIVMTRTSTGQHPWSNGDPRGTLHVRAEVRGLLPLQAPLWQPAMVYDQDKHRAASVVEWGPQRAERLQGYGCGSKPCPKTCRGQQPGAKRKDVEKSSPWRDPAGEGKAVTKPLLSLQGLDPVAKAQLLALSLLALEMQVASLPLDFVRYVPPPPQGPAVGASHVGPGDAGGIPAAGAREVYSPPPRHLAISLLILEMQVVSLPLEVFVRCVSTPPPPPSWRY